MSEFKFTGNYYVSKSGNDTNPGTDPNNPLLTLQQLAINTTVTNRSAVIGTGNYNENIIGVPAGSDWQGDGLVVITNPTPGGSTEAISRALDVGRDLIFDGWITIFDNQDFGVYERCIFNGGAMNCIKSSTQKTKVALLSCKLINVSINMDCIMGGISKDILPFYVIFDRTMFLSSSLAFNRADEPDDLFIQSCYIDENTTLDFTGFGTTGGGTITFLNCNIRGTIIDPDNATSQVNCIDADPLFLGDPDKFEFLVSTNSPMLGAGYIGVNIGDVKTGNLQNSTSTEFGIAPASAGNTIFNVNQALELGSGTSSARESAQIDLGRVVNSPFLKLNGISDFLNNVPDFNNALVNPNNLTVEIRYAGVDLVFTAYKPFKWNERILLDNTNKSTGEAGFDWNNVRQVQFRYIQVRVTIRNNYNPA